MQETAPTTKTITTTMTKAGEEQNPAKKPPDD